ncbi:bifunctional ADP-dependent NAD(P)H-hydrate dehydratase/NAD(P)H-hydrate epimerase [Nocardioides bizhenqiangii]|uniref:Bifunctional NAD(P)H-hydrate repair enzyme n=1 Tax=Nocardioides bizhenqiangii TaxID=3095076 RepID=A0ABZ0ZPL2_9ACTN|nr:bifunctional ADP-dependent NAD(P)H-hydrate dehydratase/NAD(P)H-hydrate epimerase [Nocardioides sp. HM61]WQQ25759.1 bifunctional ADP-dependent NAD(P)H-hydrate dehydratase/NAD(P)H-hydrate epimerase [Nocardioides sp. HM61]
MIRAHTVEQVRAAEETLLAELPEGALMQRAAHGLAHAVLDLLGGGYGGRVLLLVGSGDNGGDALYAGAVLARRGAYVEAWLLAEKVHPGGADALKRAGGTLRRLDTPSPSGSGYSTSGSARWSSRERAQRATGSRPRSFDVVVDGIVGIGGRPPLRADAAAALEQVAGIPMVAVDTPSGVDVDSGELAGPHVSADVTVTFGTHKVAHLVDPAALHSGVVHLVDIGLDLPAPALEALQPDDVAALLPSPDPHAHKYTRGVVGVRAGSSTYPGAALLSVAGADCGLAGMVRYVGDPAVQELVRAAHPEVVGDGRVQAWVVGSGADDGAKDSLRTALTDDLPLVVDADALAFADLVTGLPAVLTPHAGELAGMLGVDRADVEARPLHHVREAAELYRTTVLLKGRHSLVAEPGRPVRVTTTGTPWLATAGAGDVLGGVIGALLATGLTPYDAASVGSWLHGAAATYASQGGPIVAGDVARALPVVVASLTR